VCVGYCLFCEACVKIDDISEVGCIPTYLQWVVVVTEFYCCSCESSCNRWDQTWTFPIKCEHNKCYHCFGHVQCLG
jgi:hypothetical protein